MSARAECDVDAILAWLSRRGVTASAAGRWHDRLLASIATLERDPQRCALASEAEELGLEVRELLFGRRPNVYRILFLVQQRLVNVLHIRHSARDVLQPGDLP
jgi:plasmid stabilization system protein ParE